MKLRALLLLAVLSGCSLFQPTKELYPDLPKDVYGLKAVVTLTETGAYAYQSRPLCGSKKATVICSDWSVVQKIEISRASAWEAVRAAENVPDDNTIEAAQRAISTFKTIVELVSPAK